jgi:glycosyltransferase involved in cell wall biosynthesis/GT2 family glycosyltransferase
MGGVGTYATIMPATLAKAGHDVTLLTKQCEGAPVYETIDGYAVHRLVTDHPWTGDEAKADDELFSLEMHSLRSYVGIFAREVQRKIAQLHAEHPFDVVLAQDVEAPTWLAQDRRMVLGELLELPFVIFVHSPHWQIQHFNGDSIYDRHEYHRHLYEKEVMSLADGIIVASRSMEAEVMRDIGPVASRVRRIPLPHGSIPAQANFDKRLGNADSQSECRIVFSGRIELRKGVEDLFEAVIPLMEEDPRVTLHMLGKDTPHPTLSGTVGESLLRRYVGPELRGRVVFRGWMPREELWAEYAKATLGVVPSPWEPFSFACQEMMACGTPIVATQTGGMADMISNGVNGLLCEAGNPDKLHDALRIAINADEATRRGWAYNAAISIRSMCDNDRIADETVAFLKQVVGWNRKSMAKNGRIPVPGNLPFGDQPARNLRKVWKTKPVRKVGVIVPCYNLGAYLAECLDSVARQDCADLRIMTYVVDDGSDAPETLEALSAAKKRPRVEVLRFRNAGLPAARNRGAIAAIGQACDALLFLDCDDWIEPSLVGKAAAVLDRHPECGAVTAWTHSVGRMHTYWAPPHPQFPFLLAECMSTPPALVRRDAFMDVGGVHEDMRYAYEDWDFWISIAKAGHSILTIPEPLIVYRMREGSMSSMYNFRTREHGRRAMTERHEDLFRRYARDVALLQDGLYYDIAGRYHSEFEPVRKQRDQLVIDIGWNQKEWKYFKGLYEEALARHAADLAELEKLRRSAQP